MVRDTLAGGTILLVVEEEDSLDDRAEESTSLAETRFEARRTGVSRTLVGTLLATLALSAAIVEILEVEAEAEIRRGVVDNLGVDDESVGFVSSETSDPLAKLRGSAVVALEDPALEVPSLATGSTA